MKYRVLLAILFSGMLALSQASSLLGFSPPQTSTVSSTQDPRAVAIITQSLSAVAGQVPLTDITLQGTATYTAGSDTETGTATLEATSHNESRVTLNLSDGVHEWIRNGTAGVRSGPDGQTHAIAGHNLWTAPSWFFPALTLAQNLKNPSSTFSDLGQESRAGQTVEHLKLENLPQGASSATAAIIGGLSATDVYLAASALPVAIGFNAHPDNNFHIDLPVEVQFSDYRPVSGMRVPFHIQKFIQGSLLLDVVVSSVSVNSGIPDEAFTLPATEGVNQ